MSMAPGTILGERFAIVGTLGSGGTATVYLAVDQLRGAKVALKVVHAHLAADAKVRRRLQREVRASSLLSHPAALVPWDLHEVDGRLCLSMPYHEGRTLAELVSAEGRLSIPLVRKVGIRVAGALEQAHRAGLLHLDVTPNNVLVEGGQDPVLTDFGLSRAQTDATRSTSVMGTVGYLAPERMGDSRPQPASDLYGLGCVLYLALTGKPPFPTDQPMAALQAQLAGAFTPIRELRPDCPEDLALTVEALLAADPEARPATAAGVSRALVEERAPASAAPSPTTVSRMAHLEPGDHAVVVQEREEDRARRNQLRIDAKKAPNTVEAVVSKRARELVQGVLTYVGLNQGAEVPPERMLVQAVADEASVDANMLSEPVVVLQKKFVLADRISRDAATRIASDAQSAGFKAEVALHPEPGAMDTAKWMRTALAVGWVAYGMSFTTPYRVFSFYFLFVMIAVSIVIGRQLAQHKGDLHKLPVAFTNRLDRWLSTPTPGRFALDTEGEQVAEQPPPTTTSTRGGQLLARAHSELDALERTIDQLQLSDLAAGDLRRTATALRERADQLAEQVDRLDTELEKPIDDASWMEPRLDRLRTKQRAGEPVDPEEISRLEASIRAAADAEALHQRLESQLTAAVAGLLEIASTASSVRRNLLADPEPAAATRALDDLRREAQAASHAHQEMA